MAASSASTLVSGSSPRGDQEIAALEAGGRGGRRLGDVLQQEAVALGQADRAPSRRAARGWAIATPSVRTAPARPSARSSRWRAQRDGRRLREQEPAVEPRGAEAEQRAVGVEQRAAGRAARQGRGVDEARDRRGGRAGRASARRRPRSRRAWRAAVDPTAAPARPRRRRAPGVGSASGQARGGASPVSVARRASVRSGSCAMSVAGATSPSARATARRSARTPWVPTRTRPGASTMPEPRPPRAMATSEGATASTSSRSVFGGRVVHSDLQVTSDYGSPSTQTGARRGSVAITVGAVTGGARDVQLAADGLEPIGQPAQPAAPRRLRAADAVVARSR